MDPPFPTPLIHVRLTNQCAGSITVTASKLPSKRRLKGKYPTRQPSKCYHFWRNPCMAGFPPLGETTSILKEWTPEPATPPKGTRGKPLIFFWGGVAHDRDASARAVVALLWLVLWRRGLVLSRGPAWTPLEGPRKMVTVRFQVGSCGYVKSRPHSGLGLSPKLPSCKLSGGDRKNRFGNLPEYWKQQLSLLKTIRICLLQCLS